MEEKIMPDSSHLITVPVGKLGIIPLVRCKALGEKVDSYLARWRAERHNEHKDNITFAGYERDSYILKSSCPRFGSGEAKGTLQDSVRGTDVYIMVDVVNHSIEYKICGKTNMMSPDDHYSDMKRVIAAMAGKANRITVIMPFMYESRQHKRSSRESLDCAIALQELVGLGVDNIITFDAHDPRVQNAIPLKGFETVQPAYQFIKNILRNAPDMKLDKDHLMVISPDEGGMRRAVFYSNQLGVDMGMFFKRRNYSTLVNGEHPVISMEFLGNDVSGKDVIIVDDMIASGKTVLEVAKELKKRNAARVIICATFGLFNDGLEKLDQAYKEKVFDHIYTTNLCYCPSALKERPYYHNVDLSRYIALIIDTLNHDTSVNDIMNATKRIQELLEERSKNISSK